MSWRWFSKIPDKLIEVVMSARASFVFPHQNDLGIFIVSSRKGIVLPIIYCSVDLFDSLFARSRWPEDGWTDL